MHATLPSPLGFPISEDHALGSGLYISGEGLRLGADRHHFLIHREVGLPRRVRATEVIHVLLGAEVELLPTAAHLANRLGVPLTIFSR